MVTKHRSNYDEADIHGSQSKNEELPSPIGVNEQGQQDRCDKHVG